MNPLPEERSLILEDLRELAQAFARAIQRRDAQGQTLPPPRKAKDNRTRERARKTARAINRSTKTRHNAPAALQTALRKGDGT